MKILQLTLETKRLSPAEAELWVFVQVDEPGSAVQLRGSLSGPHCPKAETIQLAYPLKPIGTSNQPDDVVAGRIVIPEPNCWTPDMPFVYEGVVEIWRNDQCVASKPIRTMFKAL